MRTHAELIQTHPHHQCQVLRYYLKRNYLPIFNMIYYYQFLISLLVTVATYAAPENLIEQKKTAPVPRQVKGTNNDLKTASSSYSHQYSNWGGNNPGGYGFAITGVGTIEDRRDFDPSYNTLGGYDGSIKNTGYGSSGYGNTGYGGNLGSGGYGGNLGSGGYGGNLGSVGYGGNFGSGGYGGNLGSGGYGGNLGSGGYGGNLGSGGYDGYSQSGYGASGPNGYGTSGFGTSGLDGTGGYFSNAGYGSGNGGYGGYGGNGGLTSYYGYNNPQYQGAGHLGYGYYNKKAGYGNIYSNSITPSLVTGYRGYTRR